MTKITGEEDYVYVWTLGVEGMGDGSDKLVTVDVRKGSPTFGKAIRSASVGGRHEAHHGGFTDDRRQFWAAGLSDSKIFIFDVASDPANPKLVKTIDDFVEKSGGAAGPHGAYALPGRMLIPSLSNKDPRRPRCPRRVFERWHLHRDPLAADRQGSEGRQDREGRRRLRL